MISKTQDYSRPQSEIRNIFDKIANRYDFLNSFLSFNQDKRWRRAAVKKTLAGSEKSILDIGTGSGTFLEEFLKVQRFEKVFGTDISPEMLVLARNRLGAGANLLLSQGSGLSFHDHEFDIASAAFVLRSISDLLAFFKEVHRVLKPEGKFVILELTRPKNAFMKLLYLSYLNCYLPLVGRIVSGSANAYQFLSKSIQRFYDVGEIMELLKLAGFNSVKIQSLSGGICTLIIAEKKL